MLAAYPLDEDERLAHLRKAIETGEQLWQLIAEREGDQMAWWGRSATRPYMRAIQMLGMLHMKTGDTEADRESFRRLLDMNPNDNQGVRYLVAKLDQAPTFSM